MPTRAFLLCSDEKAVEAITQTCGEMEVSCELFKETSSAVKQLASQHFDLIMADCDNEQVGAEIFAAAKKSGINQAAVAIAIVDGKKGVVNAFRVGASLVLAKPVSLDQARGTLRNAIAMVRKSSSEPKSALLASPAAPASVLSAPKPGPAAAIKSGVPPVSQKPFDAVTKPLSGSPGLGSANAGASARNKPPKTLSLLGDEPLGSNRRPAPPMFGMGEKDRGERRTSPAIMATVAVVLIAAGVFGYSAVNPSFHSLLVGQFHHLQSMTGLSPKAAPVAASPQPAPPPPASVAEPVAPPAAPVQAANETPAPNPTPDGFAAAPAPAQGFESSAPDKSAAPVILSASATGQKSAADDEPIVVPEDVAEQHVAYRVQPIYPEAAKKKGVKGSVVLNAAVDKDGNVSAVEVASGNAQLASAAVAAVKQWRYQAYYRDGQPAEFQTQVTVRFPQPARR